VSEWMGEWGNCWLSEWVNEWASECCGADYFRNIRQKGDSMRNALYQMKRPTDWSNHLRVCKRAPLPLAINVFWQWCFKNFTFYIQTRTAGWQKKSHEGIWRFQPSGFSQTISSTAYARKTSISGKTTVSYCTVPVCPVIDSIIYNSYVVLWWPLWRSFSIKAILSRPVPNIPAFFSRSLI